MKLPPRALGIPFLLVLIATTASAQVTERASLSSTSIQGNGDSQTPCVSADGRYLAFESRAANLVPGDTNGESDVFVRDRQLGTTQRVSVSSSGAQGDGQGSFGAAITPDGRYVAFLSYSTNLVTGDTNGRIDAFVRDRQLGTTERISVATGGAQGNGDCDDGVSISTDGRYVAFASAASNLVAGDTNGFQDIFVRDRVGGTTERTTGYTGGFQGNADSHDPFLSGGARYVTFRSGASNLITGDTNGVDDVFVFDRHTGTTQRVSIDSNVGQGNGSAVGRPTISSDGRLVAFSSLASNLVSGDTNGTSDVFLRDRIAGTTQRIDLGPGGAQANAGSPSCFVSSDGQHVAYSSLASNLVAGDTNGQQDVFVHDTATGTTQRASVSSSGAQGNAASDGPALSAGGQFVVFASSATNLVSGDTNGQPDAFARDRGPAGFASLCSPGLAGVIPCPCSNPPSGPGRGCNNSSGTGGAILLAGGVADLSADNLVLLTSGERPTALSIVAQWVGLNPAGAVFGMGVRCTSGAFERLYSRTAVGGSISVPSFAAGDLSISAQSAARGNTIFAGQSRWYVVYYRDPSVLGGCPATSNFNTTQTAQVTWSP